MGETKRFGDVILIKMPGPFRGDRIKDYLGDLRGAKIDQLNRIASCSGLPSGPIVAVGSEKYDEDLFMTMPVFHVSGRIDIDDEIELSFLHDVWLAAIQSSKS